MVLLGLRTVIHPAPDLAASRAWYARLPGVEPYFDEPSTALAALLTEVLPGEGPGR